MRLCLQWSCPLASVALLLGALAQLVPEAGAQRSQIPRRPATQQASAPAPATAEPLPAPGPAAWPSFRQNERLTGVAGSELPETLELLWTHEAGDLVPSTAAIVGGHVYIGSLSGELLCLDRATGERVWTYLTVEDVQPNTFRPGFKSSPTVTADAVYLGDEDGVFHAVRRVDGVRLWTFQTDGEIISSATVSGERILFGSYDNLLYCLNAADGSLAWSVATDGYVNCTPAIAEGKTFITGCDEFLRVIDVQSGAEESQMSLESYVIASPAVDGNLLYIGTYASTVLAVDWKQGNVVWTYKDESRALPYHSSAALTQQYVVVGGRDKQVHCIDRTTGQSVWTAATRARVDSSPAIVGNRVFIGSSDGNLYEFDLKTGHERWKFSAGKPITASPAIGEGCLVVGSESSEGYIYCFGKR